jgi:superfamily II DNA or RNA helicase
MHVGSAKGGLAAELDGAPAPRCTILVPFDRPRLAAPTSRWKRATLGVVASSLGARMLAGSLVGGATRLHPRLELPRWQLVVASLVAHGRASRVVLADAVGLGKTVQAGFAVAALRTASPHARALVLTPAALCDQWAAELERLFGWTVTVMDAAAVRALRRQVPLGVNAWSLPGIAVASLDFAKQPEVLAAVASARWDALIVDEAHHLAPGTDRHDAASAIAARVPVVLLLTATPHTGSDEAFQALRSVGAVHGEPPAMLVRRTRDDVGLRSVRRVRVLACEPSAAERRLWRALRAYAAAVWTEGHGGSPSRLAMAVLLKRAASGAYALQRSLAHRRLSLAGEPQVQQASLPFEDDAGEHDASDEALSPALAAPGLADACRETTWLAALEQLAAAAGPGEGKLRVLLRLLRRVREPLVLFTEYRDTLWHVTRHLPPHLTVSVLHGGLSRSERREAERAFLTGRADVLLATDVASEGLNLHAPARLVVSLELPWSPVRLEQRIGRVDRIGQARVAHALTLVGRGGPEHDVLRRLGARIARVRRALGDTLVPGRLDDLALAAAALGAVESPQAPTTAAAVTHATSVAPAGIGHGPLTAARRLLARRGRPPERAGSRRVRVPWARLRAGGGVPQGVVIVFDVRATTDAGSVAASAQVPVHVALSPGALARMTPAALLRALTPRASEVAASAAPERLAEGLRSHADRVTTIAARVRALLDDASEEARPVAGGPGSLVQAGLFDDRALAAAARHRAGRADRAADLAARLHRLEAERRLRAPEPPRPLVALVVR